MRFSCYLVLGSDATESGGVDGSSDSDEVRVHEDVNCPWVVGNAVVHEGLGTAIDAAIGLCAVGEIEQADG
jgi:hypothetical protein